MPNWKWLLFCYLAAFAWYGGWRGHDLWSGPGVWVFGAVPVVVGLLFGVRSVFRGCPASLAGRMILGSLLAGAWIGGCAVGIAAVIAATTAEWPEPLLRAGVGAAAVGVCTAFILFARRTTPPVGPGEAGTSDAVEGRTPTNGQPN